MLPRCEVWQFSLIKLIHCFTSHRTLFNEVKNIVLYLAVHLYIKIFFFANHLALLHIYL